MKIRKATKKDLKEISEIFRTESAKKPYKEKRTPKAALERVTEYFQRKDMYVVLMEGKIAGFVISSIDPDNRKKLYIDELWLKKEYQGEGIGKQLINYIEKIYRSKGIKIIRLVVVRKAKAFKFYTKLKYKKYSNLVFMEKRFR